MIDDNAWSARKMGISGYARHRDGCKKCPREEDGVTYGDELPPHDCTCGLDAAEPSILAPIAEALGVPHEQSVLVLAEQVKALRGQLPSADATAGEPPSADAIRASIETLESFANAQELYGERFVYPSHVRVEHLRSAANLIRALAAAPCAECARLREALEAVEAIALCHSTDLRRDLEKIGHRARAALRAPEERES